MIYLLLRKLEAYGFKSFADKLEIEFGQGITAIVGPNGSGKSNITDAIRWVLGEQNVRNLRGSKTEDIIFAGSIGRRALGVAEVSLTFDNTEGILPLDFKEVIITRRLFRSGDSEYYINKAQCRLKDIHNLLADTGLGRDAMTVISQNKIDEVLNSKPEDRRLIFEEVAGVTKYKNRKKEALRKLEDTAQNLVRVSDIISEIEGQLAPLAESAEKTKNFIEVNSELTACQVTLLSNKLEKYQHFIESAAHQKNTLAEDQVTFETSINLREVEKEKISFNLAEIDEKIEGMNSKINECITAIEKSNGQASVLEERLKQANQAKTRLDTDISRISQQRNDSRNRISQVQDTIQEKQRLLADLEIELTELANRDQQFHTQIQDIEQSIESFRTISADSFQELVGKQNQVVSIERELEQNSARQGSYEKELADCKDQLITSKLCHGEISTELAELDNSSNNLESEKTRLIIVKQQLEDQLRQIENQHTLLIQKQSELRSRLKVLSGMQAEYDGFGRAIKSVLTSSHNWSHGVCGAVAEIINVSERYVLAIETALGGTLQNIITETDDIAKQAIQYLKAQNIGRATFLPLNTIRPVQAREHELRAAAAEGSIGLASELVSVQPKYQKVVAFLLGRTIIADHIDSAQKIARQHSFSVKIVTLDGELLTIGGAITGGSRGRREASFLSRTSEIELITQQIAQMNQELNRYQEQIKQLKLEHATIEQDLLNINQTKQQIEVRKAELSAHGGKYSHDIERLTQTIQSINREFEDNRARSAQLASTMVQMKSEISVLENVNVTNKQEVGNLQQRLIELTANRKMINDNLTDIKIRFETLQQNILMIEQSRLQHEQNLAELSVQLKELEDDKNNIAEQIVQANEELIRSKELQTELAASKSLYEQKRDSEYSIKLSQLTALQNCDKEIKDLRRKHNEILARLHESELLYTKYTYEVANCVEIMEKHYAVTPEQAFNLRRTESEHELTGMIKRLEHEVAEIGPVNPNAVDEYTRLCDRHQFLQQQVNDLMEAKEYLASIIKDIDSNISKQFIEAFKKINEYFGDIFARLFGGGQARLQLGDPDNLLDTGIEIVVQPPGKKLQNLILLSGGERALTVIALLFSFLAFRPAPFSVVDEIDAPLDEANLGRFSNFLRDYSQKTQFIVVTHRKGTMEAADVLHGVTVEEAGVSRIVSVKLVDKVS